MKKIYKKPEFTFEKFCTEEIMEGELTVSDPVLEGAVIEAGTVEFVAGNKLQSINYADFIK